MKPEQLPLKAVQELARHMAMPGADPRRALLAALKAWPEIEFGEYAATGEYYPTSPEKADLIVLPLWGDR
jgi:hypothetical protein